MHLNTCIKGVLRFLPDRPYLSLFYFAKFRQLPNWRSPRRFSEKINWLKLYHRSPDMTVAVDKYLAKPYVAGILGEEFITPTLGVWEHFSQIDWDTLPDRFVLKCNHNSSGFILIDKAKTQDLNAIGNSLEQLLRSDYYHTSREWPYKNVKPVIFAEEYMENGAEGLHDYKVWCFNGRAEFVQYITGRVGTTYEAFYNRDWEKQSFSFHNPLMEGTVPQPVRLQELLGAAEKLAAGHPFLRADFYILESGEIRFGEMTFFPMGGMEHWKPAEMDERLGDMIDLTYGKEKDAVC